MKLKLSLFLLSFVLVFIFMSGKFIFLNKANDSTVMGVSHSLACPCECPMVLEDCHMSCGLEWKDLIGSQLMAGMAKPQIEAYFYKRYGTEALLTPAQRLAGKWYEVTRGGYPLKDIVLFGLIVMVWTALLYLLMVMLAEKLTAKSKAA